MPSRTVHFLGGIVRFDLPTTWVESRDAEATGMYYAEREGSGTLRLTMLSARLPDRRPSLSLSRAIAEQGYVPFQLDLAIRTYVEDSDEGGLAIRTRFYQVMVPVLPDTLRVAIFSYTTDVALDDDEATLEDLAIVERAIHAAQFSRFLTPENEVKRFDALNASDEAWLAERRRRALGDGRPVDEEARVTAIERGLASSHEPELVEALGVVFGDALVAASDLEWRALIDAHGWKLCLLLPQTALAAFPLDMVKERAARGAPFEIAELLRATLGSLARARLSASMR